MKSPRPFSFADFENGYLKTAKGDEGWDQPPLAPMTTDEYILWCAKYPGETYEQLRARPCFYGPPFRLP